MPEGDTLYRTAATLHRWLAGRRVTSASSRVPALDGERLVGREVDKVEAWGKHLLVRFTDGHTLHSHLRMSGSWHVYRTGEDWRRPERQARLVLEAGDRVAVCFNAPVLELLGPRAEQVHPALAGLGPDVLGEPLDVAEIRRRARRRSPDLALGELLLEQSVVSGIGNIYRCEALFVEGHNPWEPQSALTDDQLDALVATASRLMRANLPERRAGADPWPGRDFEGGPDRPWVYRRAGRPCRRCGTPVRSRRQGEQARTAYWCPTCQPPGNATGG